MLFKTNKQKGLAGLSFAIAYFGSNGYNISIPLNDTQHYDLIIEKDNICQTVQCKATGQKQRNGGYRCELRSMGGTKGKVYKMLKDTAVDLLFCLTADQTMYVIPVKDINTQSITLFKKKDINANTNTLDTSKYLVTL